MDGSFFSLDSLGSVPLAVIFCAALIGAACDIHSRRIPNWLTFPMMLSGLGWSLYARGPWGLIESLVALLIVALPYVLLFAFAGGGGGDAKIMGGIGAWAGLFAGLMYLVAIALSGIVVAACFALARGQFRLVFSRISGMLYRTLPALAQGISGLRKAAPSADELNQTVSAPLPYGIAIFCGVCVVSLVRLLW